MSNVVNAEHTFHSLRKEHDAKRQVYTILEETAKVRQSEPGYWVCKVIHASLDLYRRAIEACMVQGASDFLSFEFDAGSCDGAFVSSFSGNTPAKFITIKQTSQLESLRTPTKPLRVFQKFVQDFGAKSKGIKWVYWVLALRSLSVLIEEGWDVAGFSDDDISTIRVEYVSKNNKNLVTLTFDYSVARRDYETLVSLMDSKEELKE